MRFKLEYSGKIDGAFLLGSSLNSYGQIFFSLNPVFSIAILIATFFKPQLGLTGLSAVIFVNSLGLFFGINRKLIFEGLYGFNALLLGLFLGFQYQFTPGFIVLFLISCLFLLIISVWLNGVFSKYRLPFLSIPFILCYWIVVLAAGNFSHIHLAEEHAFIINSLVKNEQSWWYQLTHFISEDTFPSSVTIYLKTIASTFFQESILAGLIIAAGMLYFSRIVFGLSIIGFASAYWFYMVLGADVHALNNNLVGSNFIFMAIGIGCFYIIPNAYSYLSVLILTPILLMLMIFFNKVLGVFQLQSFTLAFSCVVCIFLLFLQHRWFHKYLQLVTIQYYSAEKTIYKHLSSFKRFKNAHLAKISLPFWGEWFVSQGYDGTITHLGDWGKALDFVIADQSEKTYQKQGLELKDFYCYDKPVLAPADGYIYEIANYIEDNEVADVNTQKNWGNTLVMNHLNGLYSQLSHIKKDSFKVQVGDFVKKGTVIGTCGNSGRSPEPHIHFQMQLSPLIGSKTLAYPLVYFLEHKAGKVALKNYEVPKQNAVISNVTTSAILSNSFDLKPGKVLRLHDADTAELIQWEVFTDAYNRTYIYCRDSKSYAYFVNDEVMFYFYDFEGDKRSVLFDFYLAAYRILLGAYKEIVIQDDVPLTHFQLPLFQWLQDSLAPFYLFTKANYTKEVSKTDLLNDAKEISIHSKVTTVIMGLEMKERIFEIKLKNQNFDRLIVKKKGEAKTFIWES
jgi:urea transporter/murein DD-endopeptidase MepM/ murein hydrolase activator NlpD